MQGIGSGGVVLAEGPPRLGGGESTCGCELSRRNGEQTLWFLRGTLHDRKMQVGFLNISRWSVLRAMALSWPVTELRAVVSALAGGMEPDNFHNVAS